MDTARRVFVECGTCYESGNVRALYSTLTRFELVKPARESRRGPNCRGGAPFSWAPDETAELQRHGLVQRPSLLPQAEIDPP